MEPIDLPQPATEEARPPQTIGPSQIFFAFSSLALSGFGGVMPFAYRALVERRQWVSPREFAGLLAIAQVLPGPTIGNMSVMVGQRYAGFAGACAALAGMIAGPSLIVIALGIAWQHYGNLPSVKHALAGMSAVAIGLILAIAVKMGIALFKPEPRPAADMDGLKAADANAAAALAVEATAPPDSAAPVVATARYWTTRRLAQMALCALAFAGVGLMRWPLVVVVASLAPFAIALAWFTDA